MFYLKLENIHKKFLDKEELFGGLDLTISSGDKLGVIGRNGTGKTTLLRIILKKIKPDKGDVILSSSSLKIEYHKQFLRNKILNRHTLKSFLFTKAKKLYTIHKSIERLSTLTILTNSQLNELMHYQAEFDERGGYFFLEAIDKVLEQIGLSNIPLDTSVRVLSGGEKTRLQLGRIFLGSPDILLLDEPTNHLDIEALKIFENFLQNFSGIALIVSHDRKFLNNVSNKILELDKGKHQLYYGNYDYYFESKQNEISTKAEEYKIKKRKIDKLQSSLQARESQVSHLNTTIADKSRFGKFSKGRMLDRAGKKAKLAKNERKRLIGEINKAKELLPTKYKKVEINFSENSKNVVDFALRIKDLNCEVNGKVLFENMDLDIAQGEKIVITGSNGVGKTSLLRKIHEAFLTQSAQIKFGGSINLGYYAQEHEELNEELSAFENLKIENEEDSKKYLFWMGFNIDQIYDKVKKLSQGEKSRLALAKLISRKYNFLLMDEPTNHLDIVSKGILTEALREFQGTLIIVSHDRALIEEINPDVIYELKSGRLSKITSL